MASATSTHLRNGPAEREEEPPAQCAICIHDIAPGCLVQLVPCGHPFCESCISTWAKSKLTCPLCNGAFQTSKHYVDAASRETFATVSYAVPEAKEPVTDFSCLDFDFFLSITSRILINIDDAERTLFKATGVFSARGGTTSTAARKHLRDYRTRVTDLSVSLLQEQHFAPEPLLDELMRIDAGLQSLWTGRMPKSDDPPSIPPAPLQDEDYDEFLDEEDDEEAAYYANYNRNETRFVDLSQHIVSSRRSPAGKFKKR